MLLVFKKELGHCQRLFNFLILGYPLIIMSEIKKCPLCQYQKVEFTALSTYDEFRIKCPRCGEYLATEDFINFFDKEKLVEIGYVLSGLSRELIENKERLELNTKNTESLAKDYPVPNLSKLEEKANKFLERLKGKTTYFGEEVNFGNVDLIYPLAYAKNVREFKSLLQLLQEKKFINLDIINLKNNRLVVSLLADGWNLTNNLKSINQESERGFIAIWFPEDGSMDQSITAIEEGIRESGYAPICIKDKYFSERIMDKALAEIRKSRFVIIDLTGNRNSVFFEAGFAHGLGIEAIYIYRDLPEETSLEFYVKHYQCYKYNDHNELKDLIKNAIMARIGKR